MNNISKLSLNISYQWLISGLAGLLMFSFSESISAQTFRHVQSKAESELKTRIADKSRKVVPETNEGGDLINNLQDSISSVDELIEEKAILPLKPYTAVNFALGPRVFSGYRRLPEKHYVAPTLSPDFSLIHPYYFTALPDSLIMPVANGELTIKEAHDMLTALDQEETQEDLPELLPGVGSDTMGIAEGAMGEGMPELLPGISDNKNTSWYVDITSSDVTPRWLRTALIGNRLQQDALYRCMIDHPDWIQYTDWTLPQPPRLPEDDVNFTSYISKMDLPDIDISKALLPTEELEKRHWLHIFQTALQFSQAYVSSTWYQGGNNHLSLLYNFLWDVSLNQVFHPNLMFQNVVSYKLGLNSLPANSFHKYSISEDIFQWNMQFGFKAFSNWFYSITSQFKTQLLRNYEETSSNRIASLLSPGSLNFGLGMTYNKENAKKTFKISASIAPFSYNLSMVLDPNLVESTYKSYNIDYVDGHPLHKTHSEFGSNAEINILWKMHDNVSYRTRLFLFSDYRSFLGDWENTFDFTINKFLSTQLYVNLRYDSKSALIGGSRWGHWMLKEILSFGISYRFSTK